MCFVNVKGSKGHCSLHWSVSLAGHTVGHIRGGIRRLGGVAHTGFAHNSNIIDYFRFKYRMCLFQLSFHPNHCLFISVSNQEVHPPNSHLVLLFTFTCAKKTPPPFTWTDRQRTCIQWRGAWGYWTSMSGLQSLDPLHMRDHCSPAKICRNSKLAKCGEEDHINYKYSRGCSELKRNNYKYSKPNVVLPCSRSVVSFKV